MQAIAQDFYGPLEMLELKTLEEPAIGDDEVRVRVLAAGVNPADCAVVHGEPYLVRLASGLRKPSPPVGGSDLAGVVAAVGRKVTRLKVGDEVFGAGRGAFAEYAVAAEKHLVRKPAGVSFAQAAAVPMAGLVALQALRDQGRVQAGQKVLVTGAGGGIGSLAVQLARSMGAHVTAACSAAKLERVRTLGADEVLLHTPGVLPRGPFDFILDNAGRDSLGALCAALTPTGTLVPNNGHFENRWVGSLGQVIAARLLSLFVGHRLRPFLSLPNQADLQTLADLLGSGAIVPLLDGSYPLEKAREALRRVEQGRALGKVVLVPQAL